MISEIKPAVPARWRRIIATYLSTFLVLMLGVLILFGLRRERRRGEWLLHSQQVQLALERTLSDVRDAEVGQRGFLLTGDSSYLEPYERGKQAVSEHAALVKSLTADNPAQRVRAGTMVSLVDRRMGRLENNIQLGAIGRTDSAIIIARMGAGKILMDSLRANIAEMIAAEDTLLEARESSTRSQQATTLLIVLIGTIVAAAVGLYLNLLLGHMAKSQMLASRELTETNATLTKQSGELQSLNDQLSEQAVELELQSQHLQEQAAELETQRDELIETTVQLGERTAAAEEANRAKTDFLNAMSHELRTPLNAIGGYAQLMELGIRGPVTAEQSEDLARIQRSQRHLLSLINDVLNFAKIEAGHVEYELLDISIHEIVTAVDELVRPQMEAKNIEYKCDAGPEELLVRVDPEKALQVLLNLLSNAVKFTPENGRIEVWVEHNDGLAMIHVRDDGVGIPPDRQSAIFEPFIQVGRTLSGTAEGTGLGLAISRDLARGMHGDLSVVSQKGNGSTFTFTLLTTAKAAS